jgi:hypothetical protein
MCADRGRPVTVRPRRIGALIGLVAVGLALMAPAVRADGDPASDVLYFQDVFLPFPAPSATASQKLATAVSAANMGGFRIKVAVIASAQDLGSVPSLFGRPQLYAQFLGVELQSFYKERLLVVMPSGFGVYRGGKSIAADQRVLAGLEAGASADDVTSSAAGAVEKLQKALSGQTKGDSEPPRVRALPSSGKRGGTATLRFTVSDNSGRAREELRVYGANYLLYATLKQPLAPVRSGVVRTVLWKVPRSLKAPKLKFCVLAADPGGNLSTASCAKLQLT